MSAARKDPKSMTRALTPEDVAVLRLLYKYDDRRGCLVWNPKACFPGSCRTPNAPAGNVRVLTGKPSTHRIRKEFIVKYNKAWYLAHRVIYAIVHGELSPSLEIDHIDGDFLNNRIENLRAVTKVENTQNQHHANICKISGLPLGVTRVKKPPSRPFRASILIPGTRKKRLLGNFATPEEAHAAYVKAKQEMHPGYVAS